jgi:hypothetical protein
MLVHLFVSDLTFKFKGECYSESSFASRCFGALRHLIDQSEYIILGHATMRVSFRNIQV